MVITGCGPINDPLSNSIASHFAECGVKELAMRHLLGSSKDLLNKQQASSTVDPIL